MISSTSETRYDGPDSLTIVRPIDQSLRVEIASQYDERSAPWTTTEIFAADNQKVFSLSYFDIDGAVTFPQQNMVQLPLSGRAGEKHTLQISVIDRSYKLDSDIHFLPLAGLQSRLFPVRPPILPYQVGPPKGLQNTIKDVGIVFAGIIFTIGGIWLALTGKSTSDRVAGIAGVLLFGGGAVFSARSLFFKYVPPRGTHMAGSIPRIVSYFPLIAVGVEVIWLIVMFMGLLFIVGDTPFKNTPEKARLGDLLAMIPLAIGLLSGVVALIARAPRQPLDWIFLIIGLLLCAAFMFPFTHEFFAG